MGVGKKAGSVVALAGLRKGGGRLDWTAHQDCMEISPTTRRLLLSAASLTKCPRPNLVYLGGSQNVIEDSKFINAPI